MVSVALCCLSVGPRQVLANGAGFEMLSNESFGAVAQGSASAIPVERGGNRDSSDDAAARERALSAAGVDRGARRRSEQTLRRLRILGRHTPLVRTRIMAAASGNGSTPDAAARSVTRAGAPLSFGFSGFTSAQTTDFQNFVQAAYPLMVQVYGEPAPSQRGRTVRVTYDARAGDGIYELPASNSTTSGGIIHYDPLVADSGLSATQARDINNYNLARQMMIAFHGPLISSFDAWELGFADAAALVVFYKSKGNPSNFDPSQLGVYLLPAYDLFNRPELGNPFFFADGTSPNLGFYRAGMAQAAWLKVYIENSNFFSQFNARYYQQAGATGGGSLPGNTPALKKIAATYAPAVEGLDFADWYRRQYVLDTSITAGEKLWAAVFPLPSLVSGDTRSVCFSIAQHYRTLSSGDEQPISGDGTLTAEDEKGRNITGLSSELSQDNKLDFNALGECEVNSQNTPAGELAVIGFANTGTPDRARIVLTFHAGQAEVTAYFPYNAAGTTAQPSGYYGAVLGAASGQVIVTPINRSAFNAPLTRGVFTTLPGYTYTSAPAVKTSFEIVPSDGGARKKLWRNSAWSLFNGAPQALAVLLETAPANDAFPFTAAIEGNNHWRMISLPLFPTQTDEASVLNITPASSLTLARYRANLDAETISRNIRYGIAANRHDLYPNISEPFGPGRGYWLKLDDDLTRTVRGGEPSRAQPFEIPLRGGWNQIGVPYNLSFDLDAVRVRLLDGAPVSLATALSNGWIAPGIWRWKPGGGYARIDGARASARQLQPFQGYYIFTRRARGVKLIFDAQSRSANPPPPPNQTVNNWQLSVGASTATALDADNAFGVTPITNGKPNHAPAAKPPPGPRALTVSFTSGGTAFADNSNAGATSGWAESFKAPFTSTSTWALNVDGATAGETVRFFWGDVAAIPGSIELTLVDSATGRRIKMNNASSYSFIAGANARRFSIEAQMSAPGSIRAAALMEAFEMKARPGGS